MSALDAALSYEARGWSVLPAHSIGPDGYCTCPKSGCLSPGKHPRLPSWTRYQHERATKKQILEWWAQWPTANVAVVTGKISGLVVVDVDSYHGGDESERSLHLPETVTCLTGGGGKHYYYAHPGALVHNRTGILQGIDLRGDGGYVIAPPSNHERGVYRWEVLYEPGERQLAPFPDSINRQDPVLEAATTPDFDAQIEIWLKAGIAEGQRNASLTRLAGHFFGRGLSLGDALQQVTGLNAMICRPPLNLDEVQVIVKSIYNREQKKQLQRDSLKLLQTEQAELLPPDQQLRYAQTAWEELGIYEVTDWYKGISALGVEYTLELGDRSVSLGDNLLSFPLVRNLVVNGTRVVLARMKPAAWDVWAQRLVLLAREEITGAMRITERVNEWTDAFCANAREVPADTRRDVLRHYPIRVNGHIELTAAAFQHFLESQFAERTTPRQIGLQLRQAGWTRQTVSYSDTILAVWQRPIAVTNAE